MPDRYEHPNMKPETPIRVLRWLYDGYGGHISEDARARILKSVNTLEKIDDALSTIRDADAQLIDWPRA